MPLIVPGVVLGTAMYVFHVELENGLDVDVLGTFYALVAGHIVIVIPWVVRLVTASLAGVDRTVEEAAQNLGANPWTTFWRITLPAIRPGVVAGALFGFVISFGNLELSLFLVGPGRTTLPIVILQYLEWKIDPTIAAVSVVQIVLIGAAQGDVPGRRFGEARDHAERRRLAAARGAEQHQELAVLDGKRHLLHCIEVAVALGEL